MVAHAVAAACHPEVTLIRGTDVYYFTFDSAVTRKSGKAHIRVTAVVGHPRFDPVPVDRLECEGTDFAKRVKATEVRAD